MNATDEIRSGKIRTSSPKPIERPDDNYRWNVFESIVGYVDHMERLGVAWDEAARYASVQDKLFIVSPRGGRNVVLGIYNTGTIHGVLEIYELIQPNNLLRTTNEFITGVENANLMTPFQRRHTAA